MIIELHDWLMPEQGTSAPFLKCIAGIDRDFVYIEENVFSIANRLDELAPPLRARPADLSDDRPE